MVGCSNNRKVPIDIMCTQQKVESGYSVIFPDLNWLATCGETLGEALSMAVDCLAGYLFICQKENEQIPVPSAMECIDLAGIAKELDTEQSESFVNMVTVDVGEYSKTHFEKSVKKTLTIPTWLNAAALEQNINFSQVLQDALKEKLHVI